MCENLVCTLSKKVRSPACMAWLSLSRKLSSTAFLTHWLTVHWPTTCRSATRSAAGVEVGDDLLDGVAHVGCGHRADLGAAFPGEVDGGLEVFGHEWASGVRDDALRRLRGSPRPVPRGPGGSRPAPGFVALGFAREQAAGQHLDIVLSEQPECEGDVVATGHGGPQIEAGVGQRDIHHAGQQRRDLGELAPVQRAVGLDMRLVVPGRDAGPLHQRAHRAAVVGAVEQEGLEQCARRRRRSPSAAPARWSAWTGW